MDGITVSVYCLAYNHGKYIKQTLDGFVSQKTDFKYEVFVHDDASSDDTADIIRSYEEKYPEIIKGIYQTQNQYSLRIGIAKNFIAPRVSGKYVAICEGDDCWTDTEKLQRQVDAMEANPECCFCVHKTEEIFANGEKTGVVFPKINVESGVLSSREFLTICRSYSFHTSSYMFKADEWKKYILDPPEFKRTCYVGDESYMLYFGQLAPVCYISDCMSAYRRGVEGSWSHRMAQTVNVERLAKHQSGMVEAFRAFDKYTDYKYHDIMAPRIASTMARAVVLTKTSKDILRKENREYFKLLSRSKKLSLIVAAVFPKTALGAYKRSLKKSNKKKGY